MRICSCDKYSYNTKTEAQTAVMGIWDDGRVKMNTYKCPEGNGFHLATARKGKTLRDIPHGLNSIMHLLKKNEKK